MDFINMLLPPRPRTEYAIERYTYPNSRNECWIEAPLEVIYRHWNYHPSFQEIMNRSRTYNKTLDLINTQFKERQQEEAKHGMTGAKLERFLDNQKRALVALIATEVIGKCQYQRGVFNEIDPLMTAMSIENGKRILG
eukprot:115864_1